MTSSDLICPFCKIDMAKEDLALSHGVAAKGGGNHESLSKKTSVIHLKQPLRKSHPIPYHNLTD